MAKLDKVKFAQLIGWLCMRTGYTFDLDDVEAIDNAIDIPQPNVSASQIDNLLLCMLQGKKIEAIKEYRVMTGFFLKEAKDAVERYWPNESAEQFKKRAMDYLEQHTYAKQDEDMIRNFLIKIG